MHEGTRKSDRWITPGVIIAVILVAGLLIGLVATYVMYLTSIGRDPEPVLKYVGVMLSAFGSLSSFVLLLAGRATDAKVERNTGTLASVVADALAPAPVPEPITRQAPASYPGRLSQEHPA